MNSSDTLRPIARGCAFIGLAGRTCQRLPRAHPFALDDLVAPPDRDPDLCQVGGCVVVIDLLLPNALALERLSIPSVEAEDPIGLSVAN